MENAKYIHLLHHSSFISENEKKTLNIYIVDTAKVNLANSFMFTEESYNGAAKHGQAQPGEARPGEARHGQGRFWGGCFDSPLLASLAKEGSLVPHAGPRGRRIILVIYRIPVLQTGLPNKKGSRYILIPRELV